LEDKNFYFGVIAMLLATLFFSTLLYMIWRQSLAQTITAKDIERAKEITRRLEV